ncbi:hypothetical protein TYRP_021549 [Tyrophagus putrescentiae]|nr:hypothetical protein TYRP_021549 [Tyrophagus putrescentiae]
MTCRAVLVVAIHRQRESTGKAGKRGRGAAHTQRTDIRYQKISRQRSGESLRLQLPPVKYRQNTKRSRF